MVNLYTNETAETLSLRMHSSLDDAVVVIDTYTNATAE